MTNPLYRVESECGRVDDEALSRAKTPHAARHKPAGQPAERIFIAGVFLWHRLRIATWRTLAPKSDWILRGNI